MLVNADCTLFKHDKRTGGFTTHLLKNVYWNEHRGASVSKNGLKSDDGVTIYLYNSDILPENPSKDMLVKGIINFEFNNTSPQTISASMKEFRQMFPTFVSVTSVNNYDFGNLRHIEINAK